MKWYKIEQGQITIIEDYLEMLKELEKTKGVIFEVFPSGYIVIRRASKVGLHNIGIPFDALKKMYEIACSVKEKGGMSDGFH